MPVNLESDVKKKILMCLQFLLYDQMFWTIVLLRKISFKILIATLSSFKTMSKECNLWKYNVDLYQCNMYTCVVPEAQHFSNVW